ncbi:MAG TPA: hypothetical protein VFB39_03685 [Solirubrobacteraceae bacterium]|nr:hypothetical protein [Solirubrobacteraceae bacterium]
MTLRKLISTSLIAAVIAFGGSTLALAGVAQAASSCGSSQSSSSQTYGGQGTQIGQLGCKSQATEVSTKTSTASALPFTGLDIGLLVAAGAVLLSAGLVLRWRLRQHGGE